MKAKWLIVFLSAVPVMQGSQIIGQTAHDNERRPNVVLDQEEPLLLAVLNDESIKQEEPERLAKAIIRLGELRSITAIPDLIRLITFYPDKPSPDGRLKEARAPALAEIYLALGALVNIGEPAIPNLVDLIENNDNDTQESRLALSGMLTVFRGVPSKVVALLRMRARVTNDIGRDRLIKAMSIAASWQAVPNSKNEEVELLAVVNNETIEWEDPERFDLAIARLGDLRSTVAIPDLIRLITFTLPENQITYDRVAESRSVRVDLRYSAVTALARIGEPVIPNVIDLIESSEVDSLESENALRVLYFISGEHLSNPVAWLNKRLETSTSDLGRERLTKAINIASQRMKP